MQPLGTTNSAPADASLSPTAYVGAQLMLPGNCTLTSMLVKAQSSNGASFAERTVSLVINGLVTPNACTITNSGGEGCSATFVSPVNLNAGDMVTWHITNGAVLTSQSMNVYVASKCNSTQ